MASPCDSSRFLFVSTAAILTVSALVWSPQSCVGSGTFGFDVHHLFSDPVQALLAADFLPEKGSLDYYASMSRRDRVFRSRHLAAAGDRTPLTFLGGNETFRLDSLGYLHYANISVGTPSKSFLVALDTGSNLLWLPCDCIRCVSALKTPNGDELKLNIYSPNTSSTSTSVPCNSSLCEKKQCSATYNTCAYEVAYLSNGTSSTGTLVEDVLHLVSESNQTRAIDAQVTFGCGRIQSGSFLHGAAPNGLFGLGVDNISVPSILAKEGVASNSFSMCFGTDGIGRITFGDEGSFDQGVTPFSFRDIHPTYNVSITRIAVGENVTDSGFSAIFDSGTSFTYLNDPAYTLISESFNSQAKEKRHKPEADIPFEYCYELGQKQTNFTTSDVIFTMKGGKQFNVTQPVVLISAQGQYIYCLGISKSGDVNIIGQNFMTGYRVVFDREKMVLGWKKSNCYDTVGASNMPVNPRNSTTVPPPVTFDPEATSGTGNNPQISRATPSLPRLPQRLNTLSCISVSLLPLLAVLSHPFLI